MKLLVLGGGRFFGAALVDAAVADGHEVATVQRGQTSRAVPDAVECLRGDREVDLTELLAGREFDIVIDTCGYVPRVVRISATSLADRVGRYCFISSISAYAPAPHGRFVEGVSPLCEGTVASEEVTGDTYGSLKVACEQVVQELFGDRALIVRPGLIVGPNDPTDRFTYWPRRLSLPGPILMPVGPDYLFQIIDARDLGRFVLDLCVAGRGGAVNAVGHDLTFGQLVAACAPSAEIVWAPQAWLLERGVAPWSELPLWLTTDDNLLASNERALAWGLAPRSLEMTTADTLAWDIARGLPDMPSTLSTPRETALLSALRG